jgi:hypothetical protein
MRDLGRASGRVERAGHGGTPENAGLKRGEVGLESIQILKFLNPRFVGA